MKSSVLFLLSICCGLSLCTGESIRQDAVSPTSLEVSALLRKGIVVEGVSKNSQSEKAGIKAGDVLLRWRRGESHAEFESPFDLPFLRFDQGAYGDVIIEGSRENQIRTWRLGGLTAEIWGIFARPNFTESLLKAYAESERLTNIGDSVDALKNWQGLATATRHRGVKWLSAWFLSHAGDGLIRAKDLDAAETAYREAVQEAVDAGPIVTGEIYRQWATLLLARGNVIGAERYFEKELLEWKSVGDTMIATKSLTVLGRLLLDDGNFGEAETHFHEALTISNKLAPNSIGTAWSYLNLGLLYQNSGDLTRAEKHYLGALAIEQKYFPGTYHLAIVLTNLGTVAREHGDLQFAENYHRRALRIAKKVAPPTRIADILDNISDCLVDRNQLKQAGDYQLRALKIREEFSPGTAVASSLGNLGRIARLRGDLYEAAEYYRKALTADSSALPPLLRASLETGLGDVLRTNEQFAEAEQNYRHALEIMEKVVPGTANHAQILAELAGVLRRQDNFDTASKLYEKAITMFEDTTTRFGAVEQDRVHYRSRHTRYYQEFADLLAKQGQGERAFQLLENSRARTLFEFLFQSNVNVRNEVDPSLLTREGVLRQSLNAKSQARIELLSSSQSSERLNVFDRQIADLRESYRQIQSEIQAKNPGYATLAQPQTFSTHEIQQLLDPDTLLLEYSLGEERSHVWIVSEHSLDVRDLPSRTKIEEAARSFYHTLTARNHAPGAQWNATQIAKADADYNKRAKALSEMILGPIAPLLGNKRLLVVSEGALQYVAFSALPIPTQTGKAPGRPLIAEHEIVNLPSASVIAEIRRLANARQKPRKLVAVLADPVFDPGDERLLQNSQAGSSSLTLASNLRSPQRRVAVPERLTRSATDVGLNRDSSFHLNRLLYTRREADSIMALAPKGSGLEILDFQANRASALSPQLAQYQIVHFATHGLLDSKHPELSGLVLSLVDKKGKPQDGFLQLEDVYNMSLPVELVVLSGCQTGLGQDVSGEGLIGLTRGFMYAGASRVVASLWSVNDVATSEFMTRFYRAMQRDKLRPAAALRQAQIEMMRQKRWSSPYYWAAFQIQGEWK